MEFPPDRVFVYAQGSRWAERLWRFDSNQCRRDSRGTSIVARRVALSTPLSTRCLHLPGDDLRNKSRPSAERRQTRISNYARPERMEASGWTETIRSSNFD